MKKFARSWGATISPLMRIAVWRHELHTVFKPRLCSAQLPGCIPFCYGVTQGRTKVTKSLCPACRSNMHAKRAVLSDYLRAADFSRISAESSVSLLLIA